VHNKKFFKHQKRFEVSLGNVAKKFLISIGHFDPNPFSGKSKKMKRFWFAFELTFDSFTQNVSMPEVEFCSKNF